MLGIVYNIPPERLARTLKALRNKKACVVTEMEARMPEGDGPLVVHAPSCHITTRCRSEKSGSGNPSPGNQA